MSHHRYSLAERSAHEALADLRYVAALLDTLARPLNDPINHDYALAYIDLMSSGLALAVHRMHDGVDALELAFAPMMAAEERP